LRRKHEYKCSHIDQRLTAVCEKIREKAREELSIIDPVRLKSLAFVYLTVKTILDVSDEEKYFLSG
jgi:hypothetical protein